MDTDGQNQARLTVNKANDTNPVWSPDGKKIAFMSDRDGLEQIYVMDADGKNQIKLTDIRVGKSRHLAWSPVSLPEISALFAPEPKEK